MAKEAITTKFDSYIRYLNSYIYRNQLYIAQSVKEVDVCMILKEILEEKSCGRRIPYSFYEKLSKLSCPNRTIVSILSGVAVKPSKNSGLKYLNIFFPPSATI